MGLKVRFSLALLVVVGCGIALFAWSVYGRVRENLLLSAEQALAAHMDREWRHLYSRDGVVSHEIGPASGDIYHRILKDGVILVDSLPASLRNAPDGDLSPLWNERIQKKFSGQIVQSRFEMQGFYDLRSIAHYLSELRLTLLWKCLFGILLFVPVSWLLTRALLRPFHLLSRKTLELNAQRLTFRFPEPERLDEFGGLVESFNTLLARLENSFGQIRRFAMNSSHELRTPLTVIRGEAEWLLRRPREVSEYECGLRKIVERSDSIQKLISRLLFLADLERMQSDAVFAPIPVRHRIAELAEPLKAIYQASNKTVKIDGSDPVLSAPPDLFTSAVNNVLENALKYSQSRVEVKCEESGDGIVVEVADDGPGIPEASRQQVFEPFFKLGSSRAVGTDHRKSHGLGLSIVRASMEAVRGRIELGTSHWGGLKVSLWFPRVSAT